MSKETIIFTDGASRQNPGPGGFGVVVSFSSGKVNELGGYEPKTTNNRMELTATVESLQHFEKRQKDAGVADIIIYTDSAYVLNGITKWVYGWEKNGWLTSSHDPVENQDLWSALLMVTRKIKLSRDIIWHKVPGHSGVGGNERADVIATSFADGERILLFTGSKIDYEKLFNYSIEDISTSKKKSEDKSRSKKKAYSYVSLVEGQIHIDHLWSVCEARVKGIKGVKFQKSISKEDEDMLVKKFRGL